MNEATRKNGMPVNALLGRVNLSDRSGALRSREADPDQVVAMVAHDLQSSLLAVSRNAELLRKAGPNLSVEQEDRLAGIERTADRMKRLLASMSNLSQSTVEVQAVALDDVLDEVRETLLPLTADRDAQILSPGPLPTVLADRSQLVQLLQNLVSNAIKFGPRQAGLVSVAAARSSNAWQVSVSDQGPGIAPADRERIFEPFRRLRGTRWQPGTGLGLAICKRIAENHGGSLAVQSLNGSGSTFVLTLPDLEPGPPSAVRAGRLRPA
jgi:signal transduction histidine kinase